MKNNEQSPISKAEAVKILTIRKDLMQSANPGEGFISREEWQFLAECFCLSQREVSVAVLLFEGKTRYQIARRLQCAEGTVRVYIDRLFKKLNVQDRISLVLRIVRVHLERGKG